MRIGAPSPATHVQLLDVARDDEEVILRLRLTRSGSEARPAIITTRNCGLVGLSPRQFRDLVRTGVIRGGRLRGSKAVVATLDAVLDAVRAAAAPAKTGDTPARTTCNDVDQILDAAGVERATRTARTRSTP